MGDTTEVLAPVHRRPALPLVVVRILVRRSIRGAILLLGRLWQHRVSVGLIASLTALLIWSLSSRVGVAQWNSDGISPAPLVESYVEGQRVYDAQAMWNALSEELRSSFGSVEGLQRRIEQNRRQGSRVTESKYVAGSTLDDGRQVYLYVVSIQQGDQIRQVPYTFTVNQGGKILRID